MLFDLIDNYDQEKKDFLIDLWTKVVLDLTKTNDTKKILSFLNKCGIIGIDEKEKAVYFGVPNEFVASQVKKFFKKALDKSIQEIYNPHFKVKISIYEKFQSGRHGLQVNLKKVLGVVEKKAVATLDKASKNTLSAQFGILFDPKYKFENYVVGSNNQMAYSAGKQVAEKPGIVYNPLFIYGDVGLGKTHILQAVGNHVINEMKEKVVVYLPTTKLIDEIVDAIRSNKLSNLMKKLEEVDVLILDDIQFLAEKERTQEIFHNIFNDFHMRKKQIIISSDRPPKELTLLEARLRSRFALGLVIDIKKPDFETRSAILKAKLKEKGEELDNEYIDTISRFVKNNIRELEGALNIILTKKNLLGKEIDEHDITDALETLGYNIKDQNGGVGVNQIEEAGTKNSRSKDNYSGIVDFVANYYNVSVYDIKGDSRKKDVSLSRQMLMYIAKKHFQWTLERIGDYFGGKNHATVIYAISNFEKLMKHNTKVKNDFSIVVEEVGL